MWGCCSNPAGLRDVLVAAVFSLTWHAIPAASQLLSLRGDVEGVHDPAIIREGSTYYVFCTGGRPGTGVIPIRTSSDMVNWRLSGYVFEKLPEWASKEIPNARGAWAPDISFSGGKYHLYYAVSTFGSRNSAIGLATNRTLDSANPDYHWVDEGMVLRSYQDKDDWNAIDANLFFENKDSVWLDWGSFWGGIKMRRVDPDTGKLSEKDTTIYSLSCRPRTPPEGGSVEAPFLVRHDGWFYLFVSFDRCCRGVNSTYKVVVGRSKKATGPYVDKTGKHMSDGGGSLVIDAQTELWHGAGHEAVLQDKKGDYLVFHAYDGKTGRPFLQIDRIDWSDGWPRVSPLP